VYLLYRRSFEELPAWSAERDQTLNAGVHFLILTQPIGYELDEAGGLRGVRTQRTRLGEPDSSDRRRPEPVPQSGSVLPVDLAVEAMGQGVPETLREALGEVRFTERGLVATTGETLETSLTDVWAGGDVVSGGTTAVQGVAEGMRAAREIDARLRGRK
jgi:glutamate synthase (NADPH/NADH) small chain